MSLSTGRETLSESFPFAVRLFPQRDVFAVIELRGGFVVKLIEAYFCHDLVGDTIQIDHNKFTARDILFLKNPIKEIKRRIRSTMNGKARDHDPAVGCILLGKSNGIFVDDMREVGL